MSFLFAILLTLGLLAYVGLPLFRRPPASPAEAAPRGGTETGTRGPVEELEGGLAANREELAELERERAAGRITQADHRQLAGRLEQECCWLERELAEARRGGRKGRGGSVDERIDEELRKLVAAAAARAATAETPATPAPARAAAAGAATTTTAARAAGAGGARDAAGGAASAAAVTGAEGATASGVCPACGSTNPAGFNFCGRCGTALPGAGGGTRGPA